MGVAQMKKFDLLRVYKTGLTAVMSVILSFGSILNATAQDPTTITFAYWGAQGQQAEMKERWEYFLEPFRAANPDIRVETLDWTSEGYNAKLKTTLAAGVPPDVFTAPLDEVRSYMYSDFMLDLSPYVSADKIQSRPDLKEYMYEHLISPNGEFFGPIGSASSPMPTANTIYFNTSLFEESGLPNAYQLYLQDQWTWDRFLESAKKLTLQAPNGSIQRFGTDTWLSRAALWTNGVTEYDSHVAPTETYYNTPDAIEGIQFLADLGLVHGVAPYPGGPSLGMDKTTAFASERSAMITAWTGTAAALELLNLPFAWEVVPYPKNRGEYAVDLGGLHGFVVARESPNREAAIRLVTYLGSQEFLQRQAEFARDDIFRDRYIQFVANHGFLRLLAKDRVDMDRTVNEELRRVWSGQVPAGTAALAIEQRITTFLSGNPQP